MVTVDYQQNIPTVNRKATSAEGNGHNWGHWSHVIIISFIHFMCEFRDFSNLRGVYILQLETGGGFCISCFLYYRSQYI